MSPLEADSKPDVRRITAVVVGPTCVLALVVGISGLVDRALRVRKLEGIMTQAHEHPTQDFCVNAPEGILSATFGPLCVDPDTLRGAITSTRDVCEAVCRKSDGNYDGRCLGRGASGCEAYIATTLRPAIRRLTECSGSEKPFDWK